MITPETRVLANGAVIGTIKYVLEYKEFSDNTAEQEGNFFPMVLGNKYEGKEITCTGLKNGGVTKSTDREWVLRVSSPESGFKFECDGEKIVTLRFKQATFGIPTGDQAVLPIADYKEDFGRYGKTTDFYDEDPTVTWDGATGRVKGKLKYLEIEKHPDYSRLTKDGYYFPVVLSDWFKNKAVTCGANTANEFEWICHVEKGKKITFKCEGKVFAVFDFADVEFEPKN